MLAIMELNSNKSLQLTAQSAAALQPTTELRRYANKFDPVVDSIYGFALTSGQLERPNQNG